MLQHLDEAREHGIQVNPVFKEYVDTLDFSQVAGMWIQDWSGKIVTDFGTRVFWNWKWNETWYPNLDTVIRFYFILYNSRVSGSFCVQGFRRRWREGDCLRDRSSQY